MKIRKALIILLNSDLTNLVISKQFCTWYTEILYLECIVKLLEIPSIGLVSDDFF